MIKWNDIIGTKQATELYGVDKSTLSRAISSGKIDKKYYKKVGRDWIFYKPYMDKIYGKCKN